MPSGVRPALHMPCRIELVAPASDGRKVKAQAKTPIAKMLANERVGRDWSDPHRQIGRIPSFYLSSMALRLPTPAFAAASAHMSSPRDKNTQLCVIQAVASCAKT